MSSKILLIAKFTLKEILHSKILIAVFFLAFMISVFSFVASEFSYGAPAKIALDFGLGLLSFSLFFMSIFIGAFLLKREADNRTLYLLLARPVSRFDFYLGKMTGLGIFLAIVTSILSFASYAMYWFYDGTFSLLFLYVLAFSFLKAIILFSIVVLFSFFLSPALNIFIGIAIWICSFGITPALDLNYVKEDKILSAFLTFMRTIIPDFYSINIADNIIYDSTIHSTVLLKYLFYLISYLLFVGGINYVILQKKNFD